jgi:hypothetical protein
LASSFQNTPKNQKFFAAFFKKKEALALLKMPATQTSPARPSA